MLECGTEPQSKAPLGVGLVLLLAIAFTPVSRLMQKSASSSALDHWQHSPHPAHSRQDAEGHPG